MLEKTTSFLAVGATALTLCACGGGEGAPSSSTKTVDFQWAALSQAIPAGQTSLEITPTDCVDNLNANAPLTGVTLTLQANGDVSYKHQGLEKALVQYSTATYGIFDITGTPGAADTYATAEMISPERNAVAEAAGTEHAAAAAVRADIERVVVRKDRFLVMRRAHGVDVACTLSASLKPNNSLTLSQLKANLVPTSNTVSQASATGRNGLYLHYDLRTETGTIKTGASESTATETPLTSSHITQFVQSFSRGSQVRGGLSFTRWADMRLEIDKAGLLTADAFYLGFDGTEATPQFKLTGDAPVN